MRLLIQGVNRIFRGTINPNITVGSLGELARSSTLGQEQHTTDTSVLDTTSLLKILKYLIYGLFHL
jgi:hypothetical protein